MTATVDRTPSPLARLRGWAECTPDRIALSDATTSFTFAELLRFVEATAQAGRVALTGASPTAFLPVAVDRSATAAATVLACLLGRVRFTPIDAGADAAVVTALVRRSGGPGCYLLGTADPGTFPGSVVRPTPTASPLRVEDTDESAAGLLIFSSGTTGEPKGIVLPWSAIEQRWRSRDTEYTDFAPPADARVPLLLPVDSSWGIAEVILVAAGVSQRVIDPARISPAQFLAELAQFAPTALTMPSQLVRILSQLPDRLVVPLPTVRRVYISAESLPYEHVAGLSSICDPQTLVVYGLASSEGGRETQTTFLLADAPASGQVPVGSAIFPDAFRVVHRPDLGGGVGEAEIAGAIAVGYLDDPLLTAARFHTDDAGQRWWRSGDLLRRGPDGQYVHEGRIDDLVKVGGKLAAPGDVTAALLDLPAITAATTIPVVVAGNTRLVAHVVVDPSAHLTLPEVRAHLRSRLPAHAVPAAVMRHDRLPVTSRGKVDRRALETAVPEPW